MHQKRHRLCFLIIALPRRLTHLRDFVGMGQTVFLNFNQLITTTTKKHEMISHSMVCLLNQISKIVPAMQNSLQFSTLKDKNVFLLHLHAGTYSSYVVIP